jgi:inorganic pyrophosphatase
MNLYNIPIHSESPQRVNAIIEIPKDTNVKYEYDSKLGVFVYDRSLLSAMVYPASYGFIPQTLAEDGDALDVMIYNAMPISTGTLVESRVIGVLDMEDEGFKDYKILATPISHIKEYRSLADVDSNFLKICQNFFCHYKDLNNKKVKVLDWHEAEYAREIVTASRRNIITPE